MYDIKKVNKRIKEKDKTKIKNKLFHDNILFEEKVVIVDRDSFVDQFIVDDKICSKVLGSPSFTKHFIDNVSKEINIIARSLNSKIDSVSQSYNTKFSKISTMINTCFNGLGDKIKNIYELIDGHKIDILSIKDELTDMSKMIDDMKGDEDEFIPHLQDLQDA